MFRIIDELGLIKKLKEGNHSAFKELYDEYFGRLCRYIFTITHDTESSQDIVQQVMYKIWDKHSAFHITTSLQSYLFRACYNEFVNFKKRSDKLSTLDEVFFLQGHEDEDDELVAQEKLEKIRKEIEKLPPKCREIFILNKLDGLSYKEVAKKLNISIKTVEAQISTALKRIREATQRNGNR